MKDEAGTDVKIYFKAPMALDCSLEKGVAPAIARWVVKVEAEERAFAYEQAT